MSGGLLAGVGRADITPHPTMPAGIWKTQKHIRATGVHRPLYATALALGQADETVLILSFDLCFLTPTLDAAILAAVAQASGLAAERVWLFTTHTHAPPLTQDAYSGEGEEEVRAYCAELPALAAAAATQAMAARAPARAAAGRGCCAIGVNRDLVTDDGRTIVAPNPAGFSDPEVGVLRVDGVDGQALACLAIYGCHPHVLGPDNSLISPDYPGVVRDIVEDLTGATCLFLQGAGGNVCPQENFLADITVVERLGRILACEVAKTFLALDVEQAEWALDHVIESAAPLGIMRRQVPPPVKLPFAVSSQSIRLPIKPTLRQRRDKLARELDDLEARLAALAGEDDASAVNTARIARMRVATQLAEIEQVLAEGTVGIQCKALRLGNIALIGVEAEVFAEVGVAVKGQSPFSQTLFAAYLGKNGYYLAPSAYYTDRPGYEVEYSPFSADAAERFIASATDMLAKLA